MGVAVSREQIGTMVPRVLYDSRPTQGRLHELAFTDILQLYKCNTLFAIHEVQTSGTR